MPQPNRTRLEGFGFFFILLWIIVLLFSNCAIESYRVQVKDFRYLMNGTRLVEIEMYGKTMYCLPAALGMTPSIKELDYIEIPTTHGCEDTITSFDKDIRVEKGS